MRAREHPGADLCWYALAQHPVRRSGDKLAATATTMPIGDVIP